MNTIIKASKLSKHYGAHHALSNIDLDIKQGSIVGLIGPNGAGKTTALRCLLGLSSYHGALSVLGKNPSKERLSLLNQVAYIADTAVLPNWIRVDQLLEYMSGMHPKFSRELAQGFLDDTDIQQGHRVKELSKGMITQLHLALTISIDAELLVLDEPTLGLDIIYRKKFYERLLTDYFDQSRTIIITTHQVEEVEQLLSDLIFIKQGRLILDMSMEEVTQRFVELEVQGDQIEAARSYAPLFERAVLGGMVMTYQDVSADKLLGLGQLRTPNIADLFVATMTSSGDARSAARSVDK